MSASNGSILGVVIGDDSISPGRSSESLSTGLVMSLSLSPRGFGGCLDRKGLILSLTRSESLFGVGECIGDEHFLLAASAGFLEIEVMRFNGIVTGIVASVEVYGIEGVVSMSVTFGGLVLELEAMIGSSETGFSCSMGDVVWIMFFHLEIYEKLISYPEMVFSISQALKRLVWELFPKLLYAILRL